MTTAASLDPVLPRHRSQRVINKTEKVIQNEELKLQHSHKKDDSGAANGSAAVSSQVPNDAQENDTIGGQQLHHQNSQPQQYQTDVYPGLNEMADLFELFPQELVRYFTLLKEIDAKCVYTVPHLKLYIRRFLEMDINHPKRLLLLQRINNLIKELMPSLEEKMHVASILIDCVTKNVARIEDAYNVVLNTDEIPESVRVGPLNHPAMIMETKVESSKSLQSQRSESRREALAAKKLLNINAPNQQSLDDDDSSSAMPLNASSLNGTKRRRPLLSSANSTSNTLNPRKRKLLSNVDDKGNISRSNTPTSGAGGTAATIVLSTSVPLPSVQLVKSSKKQQNYYNQSNSNNIPPQLPPPHISLLNHGASGVGKNSNVQAKKQQRHQSLSMQEPVYCYCQQVSFGEMVGCDGDDCKREWFHLPCIGLTDPPKGKWYCNDCLAKMKRKR